VREDRGERREEGGARREERGCTSVSVDSSLCVRSSVVQQSDRQWLMSLSFSRTGGVWTWTRLRPAQSSRLQPSSSLSTDRVSLCRS